MNRIILVLSKYIPLSIFILSVFGVVFLFTIPIFEGSTSWLLLWSCIVTAALSLIYLLFERKVHKISSRCVLPFNNNCESTTVRILDVVFYLGFSVLLALTYFNEVRPYFYVILLALLAVVISCQVLLSCKKSVIYHALFKIIALFSVASLSIFNIYYWTGRDTWTHAVWNIQLALEGGLFSGLGKELSTPLYHIAVAISEIIGGLDVRSATIVAVTIPLLLGVSLSVFAVARLIVGNQYAIIAVVIADLIGFLPYWSTLGQSTTYACMVFAIMLLPLFKILFATESQKTVKWSVLFLIFVLTVTLTHLYSTFILVLYLGGVILTYLIVDFSVKKSEMFHRMLIVLLGIVFAVVYSCFNQLPMMSRVFEIAFSKLASFVDVFTSFVGGLLSLEAVGDSALQFVAPVLTKESEVLVSIQDTLQSCFILIVDENIWLFFWSSALKFILLVIPFVLAILFVTKRCCNSQLSSFDRSMWYLFVPAFMIFTLLVVTSVAYPPMSDRPWYYLPIFQGLLLSAIMWYYSMIHGRRVQKCVCHSRSNILFVLLVVFLVVLGGGIVTLMNSDNPGIFKNEMVNYGHSEMEIDGLVTIVEYMPEQVLLYVDNEMKGPINYASEFISRNTNIVSKNIIEYDVQDCSDNSYLIFRSSLVGGATYYPVSKGGSELETIWDKYTVDANPASIYSIINSRIYDNGGLLIHNVEFTASV